MLDLRQTRNQCQAADSNIDFEVRGSGYPGYFQHDQRLNRGSHGTGTGIFNT
jgi:hypothetical protein